MESYILEKQIKRGRGNLWIIQSVHSSYKSAQQHFIYKDGLFRIRKFEIIN